MSVPPQIPVRKGGIFGGTHSRTRVIAKNKIQKRPEETPWQGVDTTPVRRHTGHMVERTLRMSDELQGRVKRQAEREERSQNSLLIIAVREYLDRTMGRCTGADSDPYVDPGTPWYEEES